MQYEEALKRWGAAKLTEAQRRYGQPPEVILDTVQVKFNFDEGYPCCGGRDPDCYCSMAESPSADVQISGQLVGARRDELGGERWPLRLKMSTEEFDFVTVLKEIVAVAEGTVTG